MPEETVVAPPSGAQETPAFTQYDGWDKDGTPVVREQAKPKPAEVAATKKETTDAAGAGPAKSTQEQRRKPDAEARIKQLNDELKAARAELAEARKPEETKAESSTAKPAEPAQPQNYSEWRKAFKAKEWVEKYIADNPGIAYEDANAAMADHLSDVRDQFRTAEQQISQQRQSLGKQLEEARSRYEDFDSKANPVIQELLKPGISREVFAVINDSPVLADLLYTIGGTEASKADFLAACRENPSKALRVALLMEQEIQAELGKGKAAAKPAEAKEETPAPPKPKAPKPPSEVGGRGTPPEREDFQAAKSGDYQKAEAFWMRQALASRK